MELPRVGSSSSSSGSVFGLKGAPSLRYRSAALSHFAWGWACSLLIALFAQICLTHHTHTLLKKTTLFLWYFVLSLRKNTLGVRLAVRRVRRALIRPAACGPIALFNLSSSSQCWEVGRSTTPTTTASALLAALTATPPPSPCPCATAFIEAPNELSSAAFRTQSESHLMLSISVCTLGTCSGPRPRPLSLPPTPT